MSLWYQLIKSNFLGETHWNDLKWQDTYAWYNDSTQGVCFPECTWFRTEEAEGSIKRMNRNQQSKEMQSRGWHTGFTPQHLHCRLPDLRWALQHPVYSVYLRPLQFLYKTRVEKEGTQWIKDGVPTAQESWQILGPDLKKPTENSGKTQPLMPVGFRLHFSRHHIWPVYFLSFLKARSSSSLGTSRIVNTYCDF